MKLINFDRSTLFYHNVNSDIQDIQEKSQTYTKKQPDILCRLIQQKKVSEQFFSFLLESLFKLKDWKQLNYKQMYELIHILTFWNYQTETKKERI